jgi:hypothetical protein
VKVVGTDLLTIRVDLDPDSSEGDQHHTDDGQPETPDLGAR